MLSLLGNIVTEIYEVFLHPPQQLLAKECRDPCGCMMAAASLNADASTRGGLCLQTTLSSSFIIIKKIVVFG